MRNLSKNGDAELPEVPKPIRFLIVHILKANNILGVRLWYIAESMIISGNTKAS